MAGVEEWINDKNLVSKGNYGIRVARPGYDASSCSDTQLIFNSGWPILQICGVYDFDEKGVEVKKYFRNGEWIDSLPSGYNSTYNEEINHKYCVNKKYVAMVTGIKDYYYNNAPMCIEFTYKRISHNMGFTPFFMKMSDISGSSSSNKIVIFYMDITKDVDYPYNESPTPILSAPRDYGIKSSSIFPRVPGLSTGMFSKLVKAIKTQDTCNRLVFDEYYPDDKEPVVYWTPLDKKDIEVATKTTLSNYEPFAFCSYEFSYFANGEFKYDWLKDENGFYYREHPVKYFYNSSTIPVGYTTLGQAIVPTKKISMVVFRSPLVSPEYVEVEVNI